MRIIVCENADAVAKEAAKLKKKKFISPGSSYTVSLFKVFFNKIGTKMRILFDNGEAWDDIFTLTAIGNGKFCGGGYCATPKASMHDGVIDICAVKKIPRLTLLKIVKAYKNGTYLEMPGIEKIASYKQTSHFKMEFSAPEPICIDGEIKGAMSIDFSVLTNGFNFVIPKGSDFKYKT